MEIIQTILNDKDATRELAKTNGDNLLFHKSNETIRTKIIKKYGFV